jgi:hypothetical protein
MALSFSGLSAYVKEDSRAPLFAALYNKAGALQREANIYTGIKSSVKLPYISDTVIFQTGGTCTAINASGDTTISQKQITVGHVIVDKDYCPIALEPYFTQEWLKEGALYTSEADLPAFISDMMTKMVSENVRIYDWFGTTAGNKYDGIGTKIESAGSYQTVTAQSSVTTSNVIGIIDAMYQAVPGRIQMAGNKLRLFMGMEDYRIAVTAYKNANYFNNGDFQSAANNFEFIAPGTNVVVTADPGLNATYNGTHKMYLLDPKNIWLGVDGSGDDEVVDMWYEKKDRKIYATTAFKRGWQVINSNEVVRYSNF